MSKDRMLFASGAAGGSFGAQHTAPTAMDIVECLRAACNGHPHAKIPWPHRVLHEAANEIERLNALINTPITDDWLEGVRIEAAHQQHRWGAEHDAGKTPADWFWLLGYLAGKALSHAMVGNIDKAKHHTISSGAALLNWWRALDGDPAARMRPDIEPPAALSGNVQAPDTQPKGTPS